MESMKTLLLCGLGDQGKGGESQAWLLLGLAVRMGQDLGLHSDSSEDSVKGKYSAEELAMRRRVWGVTLILGLFLSLQLGRPSAIVDLYLFSDRFPTVTPSPTLTNTILNLNDIDDSLFARPRTGYHYISYGR